MYTLYFVQLKNKQFLLDIYSLIYDLNHKYIRMTATFVSNFFKKKKQRIIRIKVLLISTFIFVFITALIHVTNIFVLKSSVRDVLEELNEGGTQIKYNISSNIFSGKIVVKNVFFQNKGGNVKCNNIIVRKTAGIFIPSEINIVFNDLSMYIARNAKNYKIEQHGNKDGLYVMLGGGFLKKPSFNGIRNLSSAVYVLMNNNKVAGEVKIDNFEVAIKNGRKETKYKGSMIFYDTVFLPYVFLLDLPFSWDIHMQEYKTQEYIGFDKSKTTELNNIKINKFYMNFDFAKLSAVGKLNYTSRLNNIDLEINIDNDDKLINNIFNIVLRDKNDATSHIKKFYFSVKKIIPILKKNSEKSTKNHLQLLIKKNDIMPDYTINGIGLVEITTKMLNFFQNAQ